MRGNNPELKAEIHNHCITQKDIADAGRCVDRLKELTPYVFEAGSLLREVNDRKLFLVYADSFGQFVEETIGWTRQRAYQLMDADEVSESLPEDCKPLVDTERVARALKQVPENKRPDVLRQAQKNGVPVTARSISQAAKEISDPPDERPKSKSNEPIDVDEVVYDKTGYRIPEHLVKFYQRGDETLELLKRIASLRGALRRGQDTQDPLWAFVNISTTMSLLDNAYGEIKMAIPYVVCPYCQGQTSDHCVVCRKTGFLPEHQWKHAVPSDLKSVREKICKK